MLILVLRIPPLCHSVCVVATPRNVAHPLCRLDPQWLADFGAQRIKMVCTVSAAADACEVQCLAAIVNVDGVKRLFVNRALLLRRQIPAPRRRSHDVVAIRGVARLGDVPESILVPIRSQAAK